MSQNRTFPQLDSAEVESLPIDRLGLVLLKYIDDADIKSSRNLQSMNSTLGSLSMTALTCVSEAMNWLVSKHLLGRDHPAHGAWGSIFVTRLGRQALASGLESLHAAERVSLDLHPLLASVKAQFLIPEYELAVIAAMRAVEIRVRELAGFGDEIFGTDLMNRSFSPKTGPLTDKTLVQAEQTGIMFLFAGAMAALRNPASHRQINYSDPTEASEAVLFADLLMRMLDRTEQRLSWPSPSPPESSP